MPAFRVSGSMRSFRQPPGGLIWSASPGVNLTVITSRLGSVPVILTHSLLTYRVIRR